MSGGRRLSLYMPNGLTAYAVAYLLVLYLPVVFIPLFSFNDAQTAAFPLVGFTTKWYAILSSIDAMHDALWNSLGVAVSTAILSTVLGIFAARGLTRYRVPGHGGILGFIMLPLVLPEIMVAISLLVVLLQFGVKLSLVSVTLGHVLLAMPFATAVLMSSFEGFDKSLEEASTDLGETPMWTFLRVTLPIVAPGIVASLLITFTISLDEFIIAFFLSGTDPTLPVYIWSQLRFPARLPSTLALGSILLFASFLLLCAAELFRRRMAKRVGQADGGYL